MMLESIHRRKDGTTFPVELNIAVVKLEKLFTVVMVRDITERKIAEKELAASEERYRQLFQSAAEGIVVVDVESKEYKYVNNAACKMFGYSEQEMIGMNVADLHPPENLSSVISEFESKGSEKINMSIDIPCLRKDGTIFYATFNKAVADIDGRQHNIGFITDTTAQKKALEKIKFLANALESINECVSITDLNDNLTFVNSAFCKSYGYEYSEIIGKNYNLIRSENNPEELSSEIQLKTLDGGWSGELLNKRKNGQEFPIYLYTSKINNDKGDIIGLLGISTDITERKKNEEQIVTSELQFRSVWENSFDGMRLCDSNGIIVSVNPAFCRLVGKSVNELEGLPFISAYDPAESNGLHSFKNNLKNNSIKQKMESKIILWNKKEIWVELSNSIVLLEGKPKMVLSVIREITERKHAEEEIRKLYRGVQQSPATVVITDKSGKIEYVNNKFFETTGYSNSEAIGQNPRILKSGEKTKKEYKELWDAILSGNEWHGELHNKKKNGELYWESATISPIINEKGEITHFIAIKEDITEHKMMVEELISAKEKAEEMNRLKTNFVNNMSHEMRTPLVAILGYSQFLISDIENKYHKEMLEGIENSGKRLLDTVNSILDLSRMEAKKIDFKLTEVDVIKETDGVINRMSILAWNKNLYLRLDKKSENVFSLLNVKYFVHILEKLLSNSIKYTIKGGVTIEIEKNIQDGESWSVIKVIDTGIGISKESHELIFEEFRQASEGLNRQFEGTGLGLTLTKKYVSLMNGKITVDSKPGQGSIFTVMFKSINTAPKKNGKGEQIELEINTIHSTKKEIIKPTGKEILVVEDDNFSRDIVRLLLKDLYKIKFAENGEMAIQLVENKIYDCILMDVNLGLGMSGLEATAKIKQIKGYEGIPIIAVTAYAMQGDKEKFLSSGFTQYISKPYKKETILNVLKEALNSK
jgi:PAS domain S-box-containing protein